MSPLQIRGERTEGEAAQVEGANDPTGEREGGDGSKVKGVNGRTGSKRRADDEA